MSSTRSRRREDVVCELVDLDFPGTPDVDARLVKLARARGASLMTQDYNLNRLAQIEGVRVLNLNDLANAVKPIVGAGESIAITIVKEGKEPHQGVGYFEDGTMVVVENGRSHVDETVTVTVTTVLQTTAGRMIFATLNADELRQASGVAAGSRQGRAALSSALIVPAFGRRCADGGGQALGCRRGAAGPRHHAGVDRRGGLLRPRRDRRAPASRWEAIRALAAEHQLANVVLLEGGERRQDSVAAAIDRCDGHDWISVHDAARPLTPPRMSSERCSTRPGLKERPSQGYPAWTL